MKKIVVAVVVVAALGVGGYYWLNHRGAAAADQAGPTTGTVERGPIRLTVASTGKVVSNLDVDIKCKAGGEIIKLPFDISDPVKKGELLLELDPRDEQRTVKQAQIAVASSQARLAIAKQNLLIAERTLATDRQRAEAALHAAGARAKDLRTKAGRVYTLSTQKPALASQEEYDTANTAAIQAEVDEKLAQVKLEELKTQEQALEVTRQQVRLAEGQADSDAVALDNAQQRFADTKVFAPIDGVVITRNVQIGQIMSSAISNVGGGTTAMTLSDLSHIFALASVDESDIGKVQVGQHVSITVDAFPGKRFAGKVARIAKKGVTVSNVTTFEVKIEVLSADKDLLMPEMTTNVEILCAAKDSVLLAPSDSVVRKMGKQRVTVLKGAAQEELEVEVGISDGIKTEIVSGLKEGDVVLVYKNAADSRWQGGQPRPGASPVRVMGGGPRGR